MDVYQRILSSSFPHAVQSLLFIEDCIRQHSLPHLALSFNGGKDCTVLFHLIRAALAHLDLPLSSLLVLYFEEPDPFPEMLSFMRRTVRRYGLTTLALSGSYRAALTAFFASHPARVTAIFMGQRRCDPHAHSLALSTPSSADYPAFMRLNPLLEWSYEEVWRALREWGVEYCELYDRGYTSVGRMGDSRPNARLWDEERGTWRAAWELQDVEEERGGREKVAAGEQKEGVKLSPVVKAAEHLPVFTDGEALHREQSVAATLEREGTVAALRPADAT